MTVTIALAYLTSSHLIIYIGKFHSSSDFESSILLPTVILGGTAFF